MRAEIPSDGREQSSALNSRRILSYLRVCVLTTIVGVIGNRAILLYAPSGQDDPTAPIRIAVTHPELSELPDGENLIDRTFRVAVTVDGQQREIPVEIFKSSEGVLLRVCGQTFEFPDLNPLSQTRASAAVEKVTYLRGEGKREGITLHSPLGEVCVHDIRHVVGRLARAEEGEEEVEVYLPYEPRSGPVLVAHDLARLIDPSLKGPYAAPVTFRRCSDWDRARQVARR